MLVDRSEELKSVLQVYAQETTFGDNNYDHCIDKWPQPTDIISCKMIFKSEVSHSSQYPRLAMLWTGDLQDAHSIDDLNTPASVTRRPIPDFENLDEKKIASGLRNIPTGNVTKQVTTADGKAQSEKRSLTGRQIAWMIYDFFKIRGDSEDIVDFRDLSKV